MQMSGHSSANLFISAGGPAGKVAASVYKTKPVNCGHKGRGRGEEAVLARKDDGQ